MPRAKVSRAQVVALPRPAPALDAEWMVALVAVGLLVVGLLAS